MVMKQELSADGVVLNAGMIGRKRMPELILPWPPKILSPNARAHWSKRSKAAKAYRQECFVLCKSAKIKMPVTDGLVHFFVEFFPPDRRHRDDDNMIASFKSGRDGIADALGINDKKFRCHPSVSADVGGMVKVRIVNEAGLESR